MRTYRNDAISDFKVFYNYTPFSPQQQFNNADIQDTYINTSNQALRSCSNAYYIPLEC